MNLDLSPAIPTMVHGWKEFDESAPGVTTTEQTPKPIKLDMDIGPIELDMDIDTAWAPFMYLAIISSFIVPVYTLRVR